MEIILSDFEAPVVILVEYVRTVAEHAVSVQVRNCTVFVGVLDA